MMAKISNDAGEFRYGLRGSKLAALTDYSLSVIRRAQRYLVQHGYLERVKIGGGRASTRWRIPIHKLRPDHEQGHSSDAAPTHQPNRGDTAQSHTPWSFLRRNHAALRSFHPSMKRRIAATRSRTEPKDHRPGPPEAVQIMTLDDGRPRIMTLDDASKGPSVMTLVTSK